MSQTAKGSFLGKSPKDHLSPAGAIGLSFSSPKTDHAERGFAKENNRLNGFGPGMGGALIGNQSRVGASKGLGSVYPRNELGQIGWGTDRESLKQDIKHKILVDMPHKKAYDHGQLKNNL